MVKPENVLKSILVKFLLSLEFYVQQPGGQHGSGQPFLPIQLDLCFGLRADVFRQVTEHGLGYRVPIAIGQAGGPDQEVKSHRE